MKKLFLILFLLTYSLYGEVDPKLEIDPKLYDHENYGCPINSDCSKELGRIMFVTKKALKSKDFKALKKIKKEHGLFFKHWSYGKEKKENMITWDSSCPSHQKEQLFQVSMSLIKNTKNLVNNAIPNFLYLKEKNKFVKYIIPLGSVPLYIIKNRLYFTEELEGDYYGLRIDKSGNLHLSTAYTTINSSKTLKCPKDLDTIIESEKGENSPFNDFYCKGIWDDSKKAYRMAIIPFRC